MPLISLPYGDCQLRKLLVHCVQDEMGERLVLDLPPERRSFLYLNDHYSATGLLCVKAITFYAG